MVGPSEILHERTRDPGRRSRAMLRNALETNKNQSAGTLRFSLWKPSPSALWFFSFKSWWLAGAGLVARGRHLMVPELSSGAPGSPYAAMHFRTKITCRMSFGFGPGRNFGSCGGSQCVSGQSEVVFEIAGNRTSRKRPQTDFTHNGSPHIPKSRGGGFHGRAMGNC